LTILSILLLTILLLTILKCFFVVPFFQEVSDDYLDEMMNQAPGAINFTMFLTLFGERLQGTDPEEVIKNAFACFDEANVGTMSNAVNLTYLLTNVQNILVTKKNRFCLKFPRYRSPIRTCHLFKSRKHISITSFFSSENLRLKFLMKVQCNGMCIVNIPRKQTCN
jgi:hypothetical protein